jgi:hypothetical protein
MNGRSGVRILYTAAVQLGATVDPAARTLGWRSVLRAAIRADVPPVAADLLDSSRVQATLVDGIAATLADANVPQSCFPATTTSPALTLFTTGSPAAGLAAMSSFSMGRAAAGRRYPALT